MGSISPLSQETEGDGYGLDDSRQPDWKALEELDAFPEAAYESVQAFKDALR